ncbi:CC domain protein [Necator americanus]|uniref:CC domain protein n=1 Tax=Necator americanus TaxID=51031 RepID=W2TP02_NECAM|nr:CC domain protein [Necator americanus]ETN83805.1 CC domain protein [Necator americanus]
MVTVRKRKRRSLTTANSTSNEHEENDWPVGPPGYGFPEHLADLDAILVKATGDGSTCAGGFSSSLPCSASGECPPGLFCDPRLQQCCPLILPLIDANTSPQTVQAWKEEMDLGTKTLLSPFPAINACPGGGYPVGQCNSGYCSPGYSCVRNACCPAYSAPQAGIQCTFSRFQLFSVIFAKRHRLENIYDFFSVACPTGGLPVGGCINGACATGYSCIQNQCCLTPVTRNPFGDVHNFIAFTNSTNMKEEQLIFGSHMTVWPPWLPDSVKPDAVTAVFFSESALTLHFQCARMVTRLQAVASMVNVVPDTPARMVYAVWELPARPSDVWMVRKLSGPAFRRVLEVLAETFKSATTVELDTLALLEISVALFQVGPKSRHFELSDKSSSNSEICEFLGCPNGGEPIGPPVNGLCPEGYNLQGNQCCSNVAAACPDGSAGTPAVNGLCPAGTTLTGTVCCPAASAALVDFTQQYASKSGTEYTQVGTCETASMGIGPCTAAGCGVGYACDNDATNPQCCPVVNYRDVQYQIGPAVSGMCPVGYVAVYPQSSANADGTNDGVCVDLQTVPGLCAVAVQAGPCSNGQCSTGYTCNTYADICCPTTTAFSRIRPGQNKRPNAGRPLHSYMPPHLPDSARPEACADGSIPAGACINGLCGVGHECQNGNCCPPINVESKLRSMCPNGETAASGCFPNGGCGSGFECVRSKNLCCPPGGNDIIPSSPHNSVRPIGARCFMDAECVGHSEGLSLCHAGVCQCSPIAYMQGIACVRRKFNLKMNDSPIVDDVKKTMSV